MTNKTRKWMRAGIEVLIHGGTSALISGIVSLLQNREWTFFTPLFWQAVFAQFIGNGGVRFLQWWNANPLPPEDSEMTDVDGRSLVPVPIISLNPLAKVQTLSTPPNVPIIQTDPKPAGTGDIPSELPKP